MISTQNLGARHRYINNKVSELDGNGNEYQDLDHMDGSDIDNIVKVDIACKKKNLDFIIKVLQCNDMLLVSRALKHSPWLITEAEYENIINPKYLNEVLYPKMTTKAFIKLYKHIKLNLKDMKRSEEFYSYESETKKAVEWLPHCSIEFITSKFKNHVNEVDLTLLKRLCEKTPEVLDIYVTNADSNYSKRQALQATIFLLKSDTEKYLDIVEKQPEYIYPKFNKSATNLLMKHNPSRIKENFKKYGSHIDIGIFLKHLKKDNIKSFLLNIFKEKPERKCFNFQMLTEFLKAMTVIDRFEIVKTVVLDKIHLIEKEQPPVQPLHDPISNLYNFACKCRRHFLYDHYWYRFTPFDFALAEIKKQMHNKNSTDEIISMFDTLLVAASHSIKNVTSVLNHFCKSYNKCEPEIKEAVLKNILSTGYAHNLEEDIWNKIKTTFINDIFEEFNETAFSESYIQVCIEILIIYDTLHMKRVDDRVQQLFQFNSLKSYQHHLCHSDRDRLFNFLYNSHMKKLNSFSSSSREEFMDKLRFLDKALDLLTDWNKEIKEYPAVLNAIKDLLKINEENSWNFDFTKVYNKKKSWRKVLFQESLRMDQNQPVLINTLKHDPSLFDNFLPKLQTVIINKVSLHQYHKKVKIYYSDTMLNQLITVYKECLMNGFCNKAIIHALMILLPRNDLQAFLSKYVPKEEKINLNNIDEITLNIQQNVAKSMHLARPQPHPEVIINYSKGDYLPYALPSLYSIFINLPLLQSQHVIPMLLDAKVSLQKHGIRLAFMKLSQKDIENLLNNILKSNNNPTIKQVAFTLTFKFLCKEKDSSNIDNLWHILESFLNDLTYQEDIAIYNLLFKVKNLPSSIQPAYLVKAYGFLKGLIASSTKYEMYQYSFEELVNFSREIVEKLPPQFVESIMLEFIDNELLKEEKSSKLELLSSYLLMGNVNWEKLDHCSILIKVMDKCFTHWNDTDKTKSRLAKFHLNCLLNSIMKDTKICISEKNINIPFKLVQIIYDALVKGLDPCNYFVIIKWQLFMLFTENLIFKKQADDDWDKACLRIISEFSQGCKSYLMSHCSKYFSNIYILFAKALQSCLDILVSKDVAFEILNSMLNDEISAHVYLIVLSYVKHSYSSYYYDSDEIVERVKKIFEKIQKHPSPEVQMHYYQCRNVYLRDVTESILCNQIKQRMASK